MRSTSPPPTYQPTGLGVSTVRSKPSSSKSHTMRFVCIGDFWSNIHYLAHRARCASCDASLEAIEHILLECEHPTATHIWRLAQRAWSATFGQWPNITLGLILGCDSIALHSPETDDHKNKGPSRLLTILVDTPNLATLRMHHSRP